MDIYLPYTVSLEFDEGMEDGLRVKKTKWALLCHSCSLLSFFVSELRSAWDQARSTELLVRPARREKPQTKLRDVIHDKDRVSWLQLQKYLVNVLLYVINSQSLQDTGKSPVIPRRTNVKRKRRRTFIVRCYLKSVLYLLRLNNAEWYEEDDYE